MGEETKPQKRRKKPLVVIGTIVVVVALLGVGFFVWHNQPSFCNAICHVPMRSEEHTSELQSHRFISYAVFCLPGRLGIWWTGFAWDM